MGLQGPKSNLGVQNDETFLDVTVRQIKYLNNKHRCDIPLLLMNSFNTHADIEEIEKRYKNEVCLFMFNQSKFPRLSRETLRPIPTSGNSPDEEWYSPGHGDVYKSLLRSGMLNKFMKEGKEFMFISNIDNLGAIVDLGILTALAEMENSPQFIMELTNKTKSDVRGGALVKYGGKSRLLELSQVPADKVADFHSRFKLFNTNNLWVNLKALKPKLDKNKLTMEVIVNNLPADKHGITILLETAAGAAVSNFSQVLAVTVPRSRFLPVKTTSDLLLMRSNFYIIGDDGSLEINPKCYEPTQDNLDNPKTARSAPQIKLSDDYFQKVAMLESRIQQIPNILKLDRLVVAGNVTIGINVTLKGVVIIIADDGKYIHIEDGATLEDKLVLQSRTLEYY
ncbi:UTP--glucose-1-phosphate uridylyltransferase-like [Dysidea avara]|uniref:UTP--glucose-1-phosphate uridylyltransferase-like n=1 Tax=Dysidea avara TaxID=196820 RepID=UPI0033327E2B